MQMLYICFAQNTQNKHGTTQHRSNSDPDLVKLQTLSMAQASMGAGREGADGADGAAAREPVSTTAARERLRTSKENRWVPSVYVQEIHLAD